MRLFRDTDNSKRSFLLGERSLRAYFAGGNVRFLRDAEASFNAVDEKYRRYDFARFYLGVAKAQLRKENESISILEDLRERQLSRPFGPKSNLLDKIALQLAYAHVKKYTEDGYCAAESQLQSLEERAKRTKDRYLLVQTKSIQAFLYSVMAGRSKRKEDRPEFARIALNIGEELLSTVSSMAEVRFEAFNALGITWMRIAEANWSGFKPREECWRKSQESYDEALKIIPNSVRVLQNLAKLRMLQIANGTYDDPSPLLNDAREYCLRSLSVNDQDQYPYIELAKIALAQGNPEKALEEVRTGRTRDGSVKDADWKRVEDVARDLLDHYSQPSFDRNTIDVGPDTAKRILLFLDRKLDNWR